MVLEYKKPPERGGWRGTDGGGGYGYGCGLTTYLKICRTPA